MNYIIPSRPGTVRLLPASEFYQRMMLDLDYLLELKEDNLLQNFYLEAGLGMQFGRKPSDMHQGWEDPSCQLRGHFLGHWLSAAAWMSSLTGDMRLQAKISHIVSELARCQKENGGRWAASIPEKYLDWIAEGKQVWAPHYTIHKLLMGLIDICKITGSTIALSVLEGLADWFDDWSKRFSYDKMQDILDHETGAMMEAFADLYQLTGNERDKRLMERYARTRYFDRLLAGTDVLTNAHANTTIPEIHGVCRAFEVTGENKWLQIALRYWQEAVTTRGKYITGSQTQGEVWTPKEHMGARLGDKNQEHCVVYNMIRLADYLYRFTGDKAYHDYIELNLYNGVLAQCFWSEAQFNREPESTIVCYFLPLVAGAAKPWGSRTNHFWCCHGSAIQACATFDRWVFYHDETDNTVTINQYIPSVFTTDRLCLKLDIDHQTKSTLRPNSQIWIVDNQGDSMQFKLRIPVWTVGSPIVKIKNHEIACKNDQGYLIVDLAAKQSMTIEFPMKLETVNLPGSKRYAFRYGPYALAAIIDSDIALRGDPASPENVLIPDCEREWSRWTLKFRTTGQEKNIQFKPLFNIGHEQYTTYFEFY